MKFLFVTNATISLSTEVEADSLEEAIDIAQERSVQGLCHQCAKGDPEEWSTSGELDTGGPGELIELWVGTKESPEPETSSEFLLAKESFK